MAAKNNVAACCFECDAGEVGWGRDGHFGISLGDSSYALTSADPGLAHAQVLQQLGRLQPQTLVLFR